MILFRRIGRTVRLSWETWDWQVEHVPVVRLSSWFCCDRRFHYIFKINSFMILSIYLYIRIGFYLVCSLIFSFVHSSLNSQLVTGLVLDTGFSLLFLFFSSSFFSSFLLFFFSSFLLFCFFSTLFLLLLTILSLNHCPCLVVYLVPLI